MAIRPQSDSKVKCNENNIKIHKNIDRNVCNKKALVFDVQRFSIHDGPGIRTTVFFKGCNLNCGWCHNPESINFNYQLYWDGDSCINCKKCAAVCERDVHIFWYDNSNEERNTLGQQIKHLVNYEKCNFCRKCEDICPKLAVKVVGHEITLDNLLLEVLKDRLFYKNSGGGVTLSGGEPFYQYDFILEFLRLLKREEIDTSVDTNFYVNWEKIEEVMPYIDLFLIDLKAVDQDIHIKFTGVSNKLILDNIVKLSGSGKKFWIRIPIIPNLNDFDAEIKNIISFIKTIKNYQGIYILPFHQIGKHKYRYLGINYEFLNHPSINFGKMEKIRNIFLKENLEVKISLL